ncbi:efflux transporter outer membrane subunit [Terriglobus sp. ADX1]|uniref:efflux transporter outer membrane subunit n=1 Tax=Terriglobus sp. ADX1 TaxID=2794063 RepID=UPI002FE590EB
MPTRHHFGQARLPYSSIFALTLLTGCAVGPLYHVAAVPVAPAYKEIDTSVWKAATPADASSHGKWWEIFQDSQLNALEEKIDSGNQTIAVAEAHYHAAQALVRQARAQYVPSVTSTPSYSNQRIAATPYTTTASGISYNEYSLPITVAWEPDFWGRVRKSVAANVYAAQGSAADLENARLLAHASLAADYFQLVGIESQKQLLDATLIAWQRYLELTQGLKKSGLVADEALAAAESQLEAAQAQDTNLGIARSQYEHAIAVLIGTSPSALNVSLVTKDDIVPPIAVGIPSELLERRPDIASAERAMAAANAQIGVAKAAYFPSILLSASGGFETLSGLNWFTWPSRFWSIGPSAAETIFDGGVRKATVDQYKAQYEETVATYRQTTLTAFQQIEDNLAALRILNEDIRQQDQAVQSARRYLQQATTRNAAGLDPYLNVLIAQVNLLTYQQTCVSFRTQQKLAAVSLVTALGGGWSTNDLPTSKEVLKRHAP